MKFVNYRSSIAVVMASAAVLMTPAESQAIFHWFGCGGCGTTAMRPVAPTYAPAYAPAAPCGQTVNYLPQTAYRTVMQQVPVTTYQPMSACDSCGNRVTAMRPVVTMQTQMRMVPYTTYQPVVMPMSTGCCSPVAATTFSPVVYSSPAITTVPAVSSGCSSCSGSSTTVSPSYTTPTYSAAPSYSTPTYSTPTYSAPNGAPNGTLQPSTSTPGSTTPSLNSAPANGGGSAPRTFREEGGVTEPESRLRPIPDNSGSQPEPSNRNTNSIFTPRLHDAEDRTTYQPRRYQVIPVSDDQPAGPVADDSGWRAARR